MGKLKVYDNEGVLQDFDPIDAAGSIPFTGDQAMGGKKLTGLAAPTDSGDAARKDEVDLKADDTDVIKKDGSVAFTAAQAMGGSKLTGVGAPTADGDALSKGDAVITGAEAAVVADANVIGGIPVLHRIDITAGALGDTDVTLTHKTRVIDAWLILRGTGVATTTLQVKNGADAITDAMAASGSDKDLVRAAQIDDAYHEIAASGTLRVTSATGATQPDATVYVLGIGVA